MLEVLKHIHVSSVVLSFCGFFIRGLWVLSGSVQQYNKWVKVLPHIVDSVLLASAFAMLYLHQWSVFDYRWLQIKIIALLIYIALGMVALKYGRTAKIRFAAWFSALLVFVFIVSVALSKSAFGFFIYI